MDFIEDLFDFGGSRHGRRGRHGDHDQDDEHRGFEHDDHDGHSQGNRVSVCPRCSNRVPATSRFCSECGSLILEKRKCASCGVDLPANSKFCPSCGAKAAI
jgi:rRNA maturation endonuclease Nob1